MIAFGEVSVASFLRTRRASNDCVLVNGTEARPLWYISQEITSSISISSSSSPILFSKEDVFVNQKYYKDAMARADVS